MARTDNSAADHAFCDTCALSCARKGEQFEIVSVDDESARDMAWMGQYLAGEAGRMRDSLAARVAAEEGGEAPALVDKLLDAAERASQAGKDAHEVCVGDVSGSITTDQRQDSSTGEYRSSIGVSIECQSAYAKAVKAKGDLYGAFDWVIETV